MKKFEGIMILSDMDDTLLNDDLEISQGNRRAISYFMENGGIFSLATGRSKSGMEHFLHDFKVNAPAVIYNGAVTYDFSKNTLVDSFSIGKAGYDLAVTVMEMFPNIGIEANTVDQPYAVRTNDYVKEHYRLVKANYVECPIEQVPLPLLSVLFCGKGEYITEVFDYIERTHPGDFFYERIRDNLLAVMHREANKGAASLALCKVMGISPDNLYVIGDGTNDVELISCTKNAYAPENACEQVLRLNPHVLPSNDNDALAALIALLDEKF